MSTKFDYVTYDEETLKNQDEIKKVFLQLESLIEQTFQNFDFRENSLALMKLEECWRWIGKSFKKRIEISELNILD